MRLWRGRSDPDAARLAPVDPGLEWREAQWCAIDLELTGLDSRRDEIIAIGAVPIIGGDVWLGGAYYSLVRPSRAPGGAAILVHKLRSADLADAPGLEAALDGLLSTLTGRVPVFHTAWVEEAFLGSALLARHLELPRAADTEALGARWLAGRAGGRPEPVGLERLNTLLGFPAEPIHHALGDALSTAKAFIALASRLDATEPQTVASLSAPRLR